MGVGICFAVGSGQEKPFELEILYSRICALLRRSGKMAGQYLSCGGIRIAQNRMMVFARDEEILLSQAEYRILLLLMRGILWKEAALTAGKPIAATLPLTAAAMAAIIKASHMEIRQFLPVAPVLPILIYIAALFFFVGLAYYLGGRRLLRGDLSETLRNDLYH